MFRISTIKDAGFLSLPLVAGLTLGLAFLFILAMGAYPVSGSGGQGAGDNEIEFMADLSGDNEIPAVVTDTTGKIKIEVNNEMTMADFKLEVRDGMAVTMSHLHCAPAGQNGPIIAFLFGEIPGGFDVDGTLAEFTLMDANMLGVVCGDTHIDSVARLVEAINADMIYANVHTVAHPGGEIRGQLMMDEQVMEEENMAADMMDEEMMEEMGEMMDEE